MATNKRQLRIAQLLQVASLDGSRFENPLFRREHSPVARLKNLERLLKLDGGIGAQTRRRVRKLCNELEVIVKTAITDGTFNQADADEFDRRLKEVRCRLKGMPAFRDQKLAEKRALEAAMNPSPEECRRLLDAAHPPFAEPNGCDWYREVVKGTVVWTLAVPFAPFTVIHKKELENVGEISEGPTAASAA